MVICLLGILFNLLLLGFNVSSFGKLLILFLSSKMNNARSMSSLEVVESEKLFGLIGDEDTCVGFLMGGIGEVNENREANFMVVEKNTTPAQIEVCFKKFLARPDIAIILINQMYADLIRPTVDAHLLAVPTVIEIPSKQHPYDVAKDSILKRARGIMSSPKRRH